MDTIVLLRRDDHMSTMITLLLMDETHPLRWRFRFPSPVINILLGQRRCAKRAFSLIFSGLSVYGTFDQAERKENKRWIDAGSHNKQLTSSRHRIRVVCRAIFNTLSATDTDWVGRFLTHARIRAHRWVLLLLLSDAISLCDKMHTCDITLRSNRHEHRNKKQMERRNWKSNELGFYLIDTEESFTVRWDAIEQCTYCQRRRALTSRVTSR